MASAAGHEPTDAPVALVTGAAIRVGAAIALAAARAGYRVWLHHHRSTEAAARLHAELADAVPGTPPPLRADLSQPEQRTSLMDRVLDPSAPTGGRLDLLVNNAASFERGAFVDRSDDDLRRVLELNLVAPLSLARRATAALTASGGSIVNILDIAGIHPWPEFIDHCTAKAALHSATRGLAVELAPVRVNGIAPGTVQWPEQVADPEIRRAIVEPIPRGRIGEPADVADAVLFFARSAHISGQILAVDGGRVAAAGGRRPS